MLICFFIWPQGEEAGRDEAEDREIRYHGELRQPDERSPQAVDAVR
jgi:hypothetical protein